MTLTDSPRADTAAAASNPPAPLDVDAGGRPFARGWLAFWAVLVTLAYALLWSPYWYPLSDSSLYLSLARSLAAGHGYTYMGSPHRLVPPATPALIALVMKLGGGIGAIQAVMTALMLVAQAFCFVTLRRWLAERLALAATLASSLSYWVFINAFTIMSEPLGLCLFWAGMYALTRAAQSPRPKRWSAVLPAVALLIAAMESRIATLGLVPGALAGLWLTTRNSAALRTRIAWAVTVVVAFTLAFVAYRYPVRVWRALGLLEGKPAATQPSLDPSADTGNVREGRYAAMFLFGIKPDLKHRLTEPPILAGRWVSEGLAMPTVVAFTGSSKLARSAGTVAALIVAVLFAWGCVLLILRRQWWVVCLLSYFLIPWLQWGTRLKPRYMAPIAPMLFIALWLGTTAAVRLFIRRPSVGAVTMRVLLGGLIAVNAVAWATEFYVRHVSPLGFYDVARRGAYADLVDIAAYLRTNIRGKSPVWLNDASARRIVYFLSGRRTEIPIATAGDRFAEVNVPRWADMSADPRPDELAAKRMTRFFNRIPRHDHWAIVYSEPQPWPEFHLPLAHEARRKGQSYWRLYHRDERGQFHRVEVPRQDRSYVSRIPPAGL